MIGKLTGRYEGATQEGMIIIEVGGVGYCVRAPQGVVAHIGTHSGAEISLFIHTAVREDAIDLYGFLTEEELSFFKQLMSVSGIGPKSALAILNTAEVTVLKRGIARGDAASLTKVFGIGKKSAERIVVELREKVVIFTADRGLDGSSSKSSEDFELLEALMALGYSAQESREALKAARVSSGLGLQQRLAAALKSL